MYIKNINMPWQKESKRPHIRQHVASSPVRLIVRENSTSLLVKESFGALICYPARDLKPKLVKLSLRCRRPSTSQPAPTARLVPSPAVLLRRRRRVQARGSRGLGRRHQGAEPARASCRVRPEDKRPVAPAADAIKVKMPVAWASFRPLK